MPGSTAATVAAWPCARPDPRRSEPYDAAVAPRINLTPTSYVVLGLVAERDGLTSYELKQHVAQSIGYFWPFPHSQLYAEPHRLAEAGLLTETTEASGRRRTTYRVTEPRTARPGARGWPSRPPTRRSSATSAS